MKYLVTGIKGQLGYDVCRELKERGYEYLGIDKDEMDITNKAEVEKVIKEYHPDIVVHCAAYTAVDAAEDNKELCMKINVDGTRNIAEVCKEIDATMFYISTDYVFDGTGEKAWEVDDEKKPCNVYGESKYLGELEVQKLLEKYFIVRISWVFGVNGNNFIKTMLRLAETHDEINVVNDQIGSPTSTYDLSKLLVDMSETDKYGVYHATNEGYCSWYEFTCEIFKLTGKNVKVNGIPTSEYPTRAVRPLNSRMSKKELDENGFNRMIDWKQSVKYYLEMEK
ncbi:dTDP-4-dehydrorhamnose reductase [[Eubacterium] hominis]|uniref:dTDP-4-dehydrorhamnose reductase n=1 Tax=[Eubacterium] hominis TaxID=2764325 RepID=UPI003A4DD6BE